MTLSDNIDERLDLKSLFSLDEPLFALPPCHPDCLSLCHRTGLRGRLPRPAPGPPRGGPVCPEGGDQLDHGAPPRGDITAAAGLLDCTSVCTQRRNLFVRHCSLMSWRYSTCWSGNCIGDNRLASICLYNKLTDWSSPVPNYVIYPPPLMRQPA